MGTEAHADQGWTLHAVAPRPADVRLMRDGREVARLDAPALVHAAEGPGVYRVEALAQCGASSARGSSPTRSTCGRGRTVL